jgi:hypothetical protein
MLKNRPDDLVFVDEYEVRGREAKIRLWSFSDSVAEASATPDSDSARSS